MIIAYEKKHSEQWKLAFRALDSIQEFLRLGGRPAILREAKTRAKLKLILDK